MLILNVFTI